MYPSEPDPSSSQALVQDLIAVLLPAMHKVRTHMRSMSQDLTVPQFRTLAHIHKGLNSIGVLAKYQGVTQPTMSKMIEILTDRGYVIRDVDAADGRLSVLSLSAKGQALYRAARAHTHRELEKNIRILNSRERTELALGLKQIARIFAIRSEREKHGSV